MQETEQERMRNKLMSAEIYYASKEHWLKEYQTEDKCLADTEDVLNTVGAVVIREAYGTRRGIADIVACYNGKFFAFECKARKENPTDQQWKFIEQVRAAGGIAIVVRCISDIFEVINTAWN